ncbi:MAG: (4Fe-4S)-binding protein, partial [Chloroflexota bacterium]
MSEKYSGVADDRRYTSQAVDVTYNLKRCIHAAECVTRLHEVFDTQKRPWIQPGNSTVDAVVGTVSLCPSGALHTERKDGGSGETVPGQNVIVVYEDSYYRFTGEIEIQGSNVAVEREVRVTLCRCGMSENKPFCDNSHKKGFKAPAFAVEKVREETAESGGRLL